VGLKQYRGVSALLEAPSCCSRKICTVNDEPSSRLDDLENMLNWVNDQDHQWWPFLFLRPAPHEAMRSRRVAAVALLNGFFFGMLANLAVAFTDPSHAHALRLGALPTWLTLPLATSVLFFVFFRLTFAYTWNRRAHRLSQG
jgi:hypothetical protein